MGKGRKVEDMDLVLEERSILLSRKKKTYTTKYSHHILCLMPGAFHIVLTVQLLVYLPAIDCEHLEAGVMVYPFLVSSFLSTVSDRAGAQ